LPGSPAGDQGSAEANTDEVMAPAASAADHFIDKTDMYFGMTVTAGVRGAGRRRRAAPDAEKNRLQGTRPPESCGSRLLLRPLKPAEVRVAVRAAGINFPDILMVRQYQLKPELPFTPAWSRR